MQVASRSRGRRPIVADGIDSVRTGWIKVKYTPLPAPLHLPTVTAV
jgi:2-keto-3-deoxy-galactonokinase